MRRLFFFVLAPLVLAGCAGTQIHPGSYNSFDSNTADVLNDTQNILQGLSAHVADYPKALPAINEAREYYTVFKNDYLLWRCTMGIAKTMGPQAPTPTGPPCPVGVVMTQAQVRTDQTKVQNAVAAAQTASTGGK